jgi:hypothetical protein
MRTRTGKLLGDLNKRGGAFVTASVPQLPVTNAFNPAIPAFDETTITDENQTTYILYPYELNDTPVITKSVYKASSPEIISSRAYSPSKSNIMYHDEDGVVKVLAGSSFILRIEAQQPNILNVENGVPEIKQGTRELQFTWLLDGRLLSDLEVSDTYTESPDVVESGTNELVFRNITTRAAGRYTCVIANDIGETESEPIDIQVINVNDPENTFFRQNIIQNGFASDGTNNWTILLGDIVTKNFSSEAIEGELKSPNTAVFGYTSDAIYPHPSNIRFNGVRNYRPADLLNRGSAYFCRGTLPPYAAGGTRQAAMYQDIDLTEISDLIAGRVFGCNGVRAYIGAIIGNAVSKFRLTADLIGPEARNDPKQFFLGAPKLSYENAVLSGLPDIEESVKVTVQEFEGATPLSSVQFTIEPAGKPGIAYNYNTKKVAQIELNDTLSTLLDSDQVSEQFNPPNIGTITQNDGSVWSPSAITGRSGKILNTYSQLYPNPQAYFTYGQYAQYQDAMIRVLNPKTNKIRVTVQFIFDSLRLTETDPILLDGNVYDAFAWEKPFFKLILKEFPDPYYKIIANNENELWKEKGYKGIVPQSVSRPMVTGLGLILDPLTNTSVGIENFRTELATVLSPQEERAANKRPNPVNVLKNGSADFNTVVKNTKGLNTTLNFGSNYWIRFFRKYTSLVRDDTSWSTDWASTFDSDIYNQDNEFHDGRLTIYNSKDEIIVDVSFDGEGEIKYGQDAINYFGGDGTQTDGGLGFITIIVRAFGTSSGTGGNKDKSANKAVPFLSLGLRNTKSQVQTDGEVVKVSAWPAFNLTNTGQSISNFKTPSNIQGASLVRWNGPAYYNNLQTNRRTISVKIPANCLATVVAGIRNNDNGIDSVDGVLSTKFEFNSNDNLVYYTY